MGASGSGKTTLLNCISTVDCVSAGHIYLNTGKQGPSGIMDITAVEQGAQAKFRRENLGFVVQDFNLLDTLTLEENVILAMTLHKKKKQEISIVRSSAAEYLTFITATGESDVNAVYCDENVWLTQK